MKLVNIKQRTKDWLDFRRNHICASDMPIIMGMSKFKTAEELLDEKIRGFETPSNQWMRRGIELEPLALAEFERETGVVMFPCVGVHETDERLAASFDGMTIEEDAICEIKCPGKKDHAIALEGKIPDKYIAQLQHQIYVSGLNFTFYYSFDGQKGITLEVKRDEYFIEKMLAMQNDFWNTLQSGIQKKACKAALHSTEITV